jgi:hypothetical protein
VLNYLKFEDMATRAVLQTFEKYQKERVQFVTSVAEMAKNPQVSAKELVKHAESSPEVCHHM